MEDRARQLRLGLFALGTGGLAALLIALLLGGRGSGASATYWILFQQNVKGMVVGSKVNFQGVPIGVVADLRFQDGRTLVELRVDPSRASIQDLTRARMDRLLVTGQVTVELEGYGRDGRPLPPGSFIQPKEDPLQSLTASLPEVVDQAASLLARLEALASRAERLLDDDNQRQVAAMLAHGERALRELADQTLPAATAALAEARMAFGEAGTAAAAATASVAAIGRLEADLRGLLREGTALAAGVRGPALTALQGARTALDDLRALLRQLKLAPDSLLFGVQPAAPAGGAR